MSDDIAHVAPQMFEQRPKWHIVNVTGKVADTRVYTPDGVEVREITKIVIEPIVPGGIVQATITVLATIDVIAGIEQKLLNRASADIVDQGKTQPCSTD